MKKNKIFIKLFGMTAGVIIIVLLIQFIFQYFWLEKFYVYNKKENISNELTILRQDIEKNSINKEKTEKYLKECSIENNMFIGIYNDKGIPQYGIDQESNVSYIQIKDSKMGTYKIYINSFSRDKEFIEKLKLDKKIKIQGLLEDEKEKNVYPSIITINNKKFLADEDTGIMDNIMPEESIDIKENEEFEKPLIIDNGEGAMVEIEDLPLSKPINLEGSIVNINIVDKASYRIEYLENQLFEEVFSFLKKEKNLNSFFENNKIIKYTKVDSFTGMKNIIFVQPLFINSKKPMLMFAVSSLESVKETTQIMKTYFLFVLIIAMFLAIIIVYIYSKKITKPLLHLNIVTKKMAKLDFSKKCNVHTNDEIEYLAENINYMSEKLKVTLKEVKHSNEKLKEEILFKEKMDEFRKRFIADASHELKTPLTVMKGICEGLLDGIYDCNDQQYFENILNQTNDMSKLVYDLLNISKLELEGTVFKSNVFQLCDVVLKVHGKLKPLIDNKNLKVQLDLTEEFVSADENKIQRVVQNIYSNAIRYTPENGEINICINTDKDKCYLNIENSPAEISNDDLLKVWEPFYRVEKSRNKDLGGTGLGLHMVKKILDKHKSDYGIKNTQKGVKVYFSLDIILYKK